MHQKLCIVIVLFVSFLICSSNTFTQKTVMVLEQADFTNLEKVDHTRLNEGEELNRINRQTKITVDKALEVIDRQHLKRCLAFLICSLSCDSKVFGEEGEHVYKSFKNLTNIKPSEDTINYYRYYKSAEAKGVKNKSNCSLCEAKYPKCQNKVKLLFKMVQNVKIIDMH